MEIGVTNGRCGVDGHALSHLPCRCTHFAHALPLFLSCWQRVLHATEMTPPGGPLTLGELAASWSGGRADPTCRDTGPRGEYLGPVPGAEHCQWPTVVRGTDWGTVSGKRDAISGLGLLIWERTVADSSAAQQLADSLGSALTGQGLEEFQCPGMGRRWQRPELGVQFTVLTAGAEGRLRLMISAVTMPAAIPELLCPGAPEMPLPHWSPQSVPVPT